MITLRKTFICILLLLLAVFSAEALPQAVKGESMRMHSIKLAGKKSAPDTKSKLLVGFVSLLPYEKADAEVVAV